MALQEARVFDARVNLTGHISIQSIIHQGQCARRVMLRYTYYIETSFE